MKKRNIIFLILFLFLLSFEIYPQSGWIQQSPLPTGNPLRLVKFLNQETGFTVTSSNTILKTINGGANWRAININSPKIPQYICFIDSVTGFICGDSSLFLRTTDAGDNWVQLFSNSHFGIYQISFVNSNTGFAIRGGDSTFFKTTNKGETWTTFKTDIYNLVLGLYFLNENTGFYSTSGRIFKTINGGHNWTLSSYSMPTSLCYNFINQNTGFAYGIDGSFLKTTNSGDNWILQAPFTSYSLTEVKFLDSVNGFLFGAGGSYSIIYKTSDRGFSWNALNSSLYPGMHNFDFSDINTGYIVGESGKIKKTTNSGINWSIISSGTVSTLNSVHFANNNIGFAVGEEEILKTTNGGNLWLSLSGRYVNDIFESVHCFDTNSIIATGWNYVQKTTNGGLNWITKDNTGSLKKASFINNVCYIAKGGTLGKSTDAGETWTHINTGVFMESIFFINDNIGFASEGLSSKIYKTINGGVNWDLIFTDLFGDNINSLVFTDQSNGFAVSYDRFAKTTNGGYNWILQTALPIQGISNIYMTNINTGFISGYSGKILKTTNGGQNWISQNSGTSNDLNQIYFLDSNIGYAVGQYGVIIKTTNGGSVWVNNINEKIPDSYLLYQNYPNPFNPNTIIRFQIKDSRFTTLKIYNILGKEIETLVNEKLQQGTYEFQFDGSKLPSGIYFYRIQTGDFTQVKKMILIK